MNMRAVVASVVPRCGNGGDGISDPPAGGLGYSYSTSLIDGTVGWYRPALFESTGVLDGLALSINGGDNTTFDVAPGIACFVDYSANPVSPVRSVVQFAGATAQPVTLMATELATYVGLDSAGNLVQQGTPFTNAQRRSIAQIGVLAHSNQVNLNAVNDVAAPVLAGISQLYDLMTAIGPLNVSGNAISASGSNLSIDKSAGTIFKLGSNFQTDPNNPHLATLVALTAPTNLRYRLSDGTQYADTSVIDPEHYESPLGTLSNVPNNDFTVQRIAIFQSNQIRIQYGQHSYNSMNAAERGIVGDAFDVEDNIAENGITLAYLIVQEGTTDLTNPNQAKFLKTSKFGAVTATWTGGSGAITVGTPASVAGALDLDFGGKPRAAFVVTLTEDVTSITLSNVPAGVYLEYEVDYVQDGTGGWTVTQPASHKALGGSDTAVASAAGAVTTLSASSKDGGTTYRYAMQESA